MRIKHVKRLVSLILMCALLFTFLPSVTIRAALPDGITEVVFTTRTNGGNGHWYSNFGYWCTSETSKMYGSQGRLCKLNVDTGVVTTLLEDLSGGIRDVCVSYDATKLLFSYRPGGTEQYHLYEINIDGTGLRQLTFGQYDDYECTYLPDGGIMFVSTRSKRFVPCMNTGTGTLFRCDADGKNIRMISNSTDQDNSPWVLPDGRIIYTRWEYVDRSQMVFHHLWVMNPDGTDQQVYYGNMNRNHTGGSEVMIDAKPIPGTGKVVCIFSPGHGQYEHTGRITTVDPSNGPDDTTKAVTLKSDQDYKDPYSINSECFLASYGNNIVRIDGSGNVTTLLTASFSTPIQEVRPLAARPVENIISNHASTTASTGKFALQNVYLGRKMTGVSQGDITKLLIYEDLPKPCNFDGAQPPITYNGKFFISRALGTVPVDADGSAFFEVPANRMLSFVALDANNCSVKRMMSFTCVQPGETLSCVGCHETRDNAPPGGDVPTALLTDADQITPLPSYIPEIYDFPRDIQPILDKYCISCHKSENRQGGVILTGDSGPIFSLSYYNLAIRKQFFTGGDMEKGNYGPRQTGDPISPIMWKLGDRNTDVTLTNGWSNSTSVWPSLTTKSGPYPHYGINMTQEEREIIKYWVNMGGQYAGSYASLGPQGVFPWKEQNNARDLVNTTAVNNAATVITNRCNSCHTGSNVLPTKPDQHENFYGSNYSGIDDAGIADPKRSKHATDLTYNLSNPEKSVVLLAPLAVSAGGYGICTISGQAVFADTSDPDYQTILQSINDCKGIMNDKKRYDMVDFVPNRQWLREMKRYGIIPVDLDPYQTSIDVFETEKRYWESLWCKPGVSERWGAENSTSGAAEVACYSQLMSLPAYSQPANLAEGKAVTVSSTDNASRPGSNMTDGDSRTRWSSAYTDNEWAYVDLGGTFSIGRVKMVWETAYGKEYKIQTSPDASVWTDVYSVTNGDGRVDDIRFSPVSTRYVRMLGIKRGTQYGYSLYEFNVYMQLGTNIAQSKSVTASSALIPAANAVDGSGSTRWGSAYSDPQWIYVDLGQSYDVDVVRLIWEAAYGSSYKLQVSSNAVDWTDAYSTTTGDGGTDEILFASPYTCRYVRMYGTARGTSYGYSLWEYEVYGSVSGTPLPSPTPTASSTPTPTPTPTPTASPTPTPTSSASWGTLFSDSFNDNSFGAAWTTKNGTWSETGNVLSQTSTSQGDPSKAIISNSGISFGSEHQITAKVRVDSWVDGDRARAGVSLFTNTTDGKGYNLLFHNNHSTLQFLDDGVGWGPSYTFNWSSGTWYWFKLKLQGGVLYGRVWQDGSTEPSDWPYTWTKSGRNGFPALNGGSSGGTGNATVSFDDVDISGPVTATPTPTPTATPTPSPVARWLFNNNGDDATGNGHTAAMTNTTYSTDAHEGGYSASFNGTSAYAGVGSFNLGSQFTISMWVKLDSSGSNIQTLAANANSGGTTNGFRFFVNTYQTTDRKIRFETGNGTSSNIADTSTGAAVYAQWKMITAVVDRAAGTAEIYHDGTKVTVDNTILTDFNNNATINLGRMLGGNFFFKGLMDDVRIYDRKLTDTEISVLASQ